MKKETTLMMMEAERQQAELRALEKIKSLRDHLDSLEEKIREGGTVYESDGLQGNGDFLDMHIVKMVTYTKAMEQIKKMED